jgi:hypothetical protein
MRYKPSDSELLEIDTFSAEQRLHYFLSRAIESEEVWSLGDDAGWVLNDVGDKTIIPIWPYEVLATACRQTVSCQPTAMAVSLEQFVYSLLPQINHQNIQIEILPTKILPGKIMQARELAGILEGMMESGEYYMEG